MMIKMNQPVGDAMWAGLLVRLPLGIYFIQVALLKIWGQSPNVFLVAVRQLNILPEPLATLYGVLVPYLELGVGALLVLGAWTTLASIVSSLLLLSFVVALGPLNHVPWNKEFVLLNKDLLLLGASLSLLYSGAGAWSIDRFRTTGGS